MALRCENCGYFCTLPLGMSPRYQCHILTHFFKGHPQQEHETRHGSMSQTRWAIIDGASVEVGGRKFSSNDEGAPMMCNLVCTSLGRHVHIDYCRAEDPASCNDSEVQHMTEKMVPHPERPKDTLTHDLHWRRMGKFTEYCILATLYS